jgi:hypothetical protein
MNPLPALIAAAAIVSLAPAAEFGGSDPLTRDSGNWGELFPDSDRGRLIFRDGDGLVYRTRTQTGYRHAFLKWTPANARADEDWFAQVTVDLNGVGHSLGGLAILNASNREQGYMLTIVGGRDFANIRAQNMKGHEGRLSRGAIDRATLRLHYNSRARTITASWNTRGIWRFFRPFDASAWTHAKGGAFNVALLGRQYLNEDDEDEEKRSGIIAASKAGDDVFFRDFRCGPAQPWMSVGTPEIALLPHPAARLGFGAASPDGPGKTMTVTIRNEGTAPLTGIRLVKTGDTERHFHLQSPLGTVLKPGGTLPFQIRFKPSETGIHSARITVESNDPRRLPQTLRISGIGG